LAEVGKIFEIALGGEGDSAEVEAVAGLDGIAAALAAGAARTDEAFAPDLKAYLRTQTRLVEIQTEHLHEQRLVILANLKLKRASERLKLGMGVFVAAVTAAVVAGLFVMVWQAVHARGLVVEAFSSPPDLVHDGVTGQVVAEEIEDRINMLQADTDTSRAPATFTHDWGGEVKVEIPETGVTFGEAERLLTRWLGHETRMSGAVIHRAGAVKVIARVEGEPADEATGPEGDVDGVVAQVAEKLYGRTQPYRYGIYLYGAGRFDEARAVWTRLAEEGSPQDRIWAREGLAFLIRDPRAQEEAHLRIARERPDFALAAANLSQLAQANGHFERAVEESHHVLAAVARPDRGGLWSSRADVLKLSADISLAHLFADPEQVLALTRSAGKLPEYSGFKVFALSERACAFAAVHDVAAAQAAAEEAVADDAASIPAILKHNYSPFPHACAAESAGDWPQVDRQLSGVEAALTPETRLTIAPPTTIWPDLALALAQSGDLQRAQALIDRTPLDCYPCLSARGRIAAMRGDAGASEHWFAEAAHQAPALPLAYETWGEARLARGDLDGAAWAFGQASRRGPRWADPLKGIGDVAMRRGRWRAAVEAYDQALVHAPAWTQLKQARAAAESHGR
jgi:tetratricopeptide (TPR) repeat protein